MNVTHDRIVAFQGSWGSGLANLVLENGSVLSDNSPLARALIAAYGAYADGHRVDNAKIKGKGIYYWFDEMGLFLAGFVPEEHWDGPEIPLGESAEVSDSSSADVA